MEAGEKNDHKQQPVFTKNEPKQADDEDTFFDDVDFDESIPQIDVKNGSIFRVHLPYTGGFSNNHIDGEVNAQPQEIEEYNYYIAKDDENMRREGNGYLVHVKEAEYAIGAN